jgi:hypothetical protein
LDELVHKHGTQAVSLETWQGAREELLANITWGFPTPSPGVSAKEDAARLPLREVWERWYRERPKSMRDADGLELVRALAPIYAGQYVPPSLLGFFGGQVNGKGKSAGAWEKRAREVLWRNFDKTKLRYPQIIHPLLTWMLKLHPPHGAVDLLLDGVEASIALVPRDTLAAGVGYSYGASWHGSSEWLGWLQMARNHRTLNPEEWKGEHHVRLWRMQLWITAAKESQVRVDFEEIITAYEAGGATEADLLYQLIGARGTTTWHFADLRALSARKPSPLTEKYPVLKELVGRCRERIIEVELARGDMATAASVPAMALRWSGGLRTLLRLLRALGRTPFVRGWTYDSMSKAAVFSHLIRSTFPGETDTPEQFTAVAKEARIPEQRLVELAVYAPQWAAHVERAVGWPKLSEAVWWIHAHTKDTGWSVDQEIRDTWAAQVSERTPLSGQALLDGAVDVAWFHEVHEALGEVRWAQLYKAAQYASGGGGHKRAQLFSDAMLGRTSKAELVGRIKGKRHPDAVRALGLLPLPDQDGRDRDLLERYEIIQEFVRGSRQFGSQRQASEKLAAAVGMENLARTAGYPDPVRLEWAMEVRAVEDLAGGPLSATVDGVTLSLAVNEWGEPEMTVTKAGKALKSIPPKVKKHPQIVALREREREVRRQASRMKESLEWAMCRGDEFTGSELRGLLEHPVLAPMLSRLVFVGEGTAGYPAEGGLALRSHDGTMQPVGASESLRIAHSHDLLQTGEWHLWQHDLFMAERVQPFKQVFRELYVLTGAEKSEGALSRRYAGHQVNPRQALALLGRRGWVNHPEEGVRRTFHDQNLSAWVYFLEGFYTPSEVDGLTLEGVQFTKRGEWRALSLEEIPPRIFSEVMRDIDLVVSVAHRGGVDPEASASTVEMRASLVRETCALLGITNVTLEGSHALVEGHLGRYSIHLGSGTVHRQPGGALCIVPVHSQHRGRLFLPFADDDPKTAEVMSKVLVLARDREINDPTILEQILAAR